jgi:hypothetical protein
MLWGHIRFVLKVWSKKPQKGSFDWKLKGLGPFLIVESVWRATTAPLTPTISPNIFNQNFEIAMLFNVVESSGNSVLEDDY